MDIIEQETKKRDDRPVGRKTYVAPMLKEFGPVGALTQAGTGAMSESGMWACTTMGQASKMC